jgi:hypothetical protein
MSQEMTTINKTFTLTGPARLSLRNVKGKIDIQTGAEGQIEVTAVKHPGKGFDRTEIEMTQAEDGSVTVATKYEDDLVSRMLGFGGNDPAEVDYTVRLPATVGVLDMATVSGQAHVAGLEGELKLKSVSAAMRLSHLAGKLKINTVSGDVAGDSLRLSEPLDLTTVSGHVTVAQCQLPGIDANTVSGNLELDAGTAPADYRFKSVSGDVYLRLPAGTPCLVSAHTLSGRLRSDLPATRHELRGGREQVEFGGTASGSQATDALVRVKFNSVSGNLNLVSANGTGESQPAEPPAQAAPAGPRTAAERLELLEKVSRGELSVDDALSNLSQ